jgi:membrane-bound metal-dependent hydrolase YbcI (DUF457 family)
MPDVLTHLLVGVSIALLVVRDDNRPKQMLIILGSVLIDAERPITWLLNWMNMDWIGLTDATHSLLGIVVLSYFAAACFNFKSTDFQRRWFLIFLGCTSHLLLDLTMYPWEEIGTYLLYPLKIANSFNLLWPDFWWYPIIGLSCVIISLVIRILLHSFLLKQ